jgi:hypothetical protein
MWVGAAAFSDVLRSLVGRVKLLKLLFDFR